VEIKKGIGSQAGKDQPAEGRSKGSGAEEVKQQGAGRSTGDAR